MSMVPDLPCYASPDARSKIVCWLGFRQKVNRVNSYESETFAQIQLQDNTFAYCRKDSICSVNARIYAQTIEGNFASALPGIDIAMYPVKLVDVRKYAPEIQVNQVFATKSNLTGVVLYERDLCLLQEATLQKLKNAQAIFAVDGYTIKVYDAYRPYRTTIFLSAFNGNSKYLASPTTGSNHNRAAAVDMTLIDVNGIELEMPSLMHTLNDTSSVDYPGMNETARRNMEYMSSVMIQCGFSIYKSEWWHFTDVNNKKYPILDIDLGSIPVTATTNKPEVKPPPIVDPQTSGFSPLAPTPSPLPTPMPTPEISPVETTGQVETTTIESSADSGD